jgi:DDE superfamily endonuclease
MGGLVKRADYCQFLMVSQVNYTMTYFAEHSERFSHDAATRYLHRDRLRPSTIWEKAKRDIVVSPQGYVVFDDSVVDKNHSREIELVYRQYSGNEHRVIRGIGLISCVYVNPETEEFWIIDYRLYDPETDGKDKHEHVAEMYDNCLEKCVQGELDFQAVLMDRWYATTQLMVKIHRSGLRFYCPIKGNRAVSEVKPDQKYQYQPAESLAWTEEELDTGKHVHLREFPQGLDLKLFRIVVSTDSTELIVTNDDRASLDAEVVREAQGTRLESGAVSPRTQRRYWGGCLSISSSSLAT